MRIPSPPAFLQKHSKLIRGIRVERHQVWFARYVRAYKLLFGELYDSVVKSWGNSEHPANLSRSEVWSLFHSDRVARHGFRVPFLATYMWGCGERDNGGLIRAFLAIEDSHFDKMLSAAHSAISGGLSGFDHALNCVNKLPQVSTSFGSKVLYFMGRASSPGLKSTIPLILDNKVSGQIKECAGEPASRFLAGKGRYPRYCELMHSWGAIIGCEADQIELFLFDPDAQITKDRLRSLFVDLFRAGGDQSLSVENLDEFVDSLTDKERHVISARCGFESGISLTIADAASRLGLTEENLKRIEEKALRKLRHPARMSKLREFLRS